MCWRVLGRSGKDDMLGHWSMLSFFKLERQFRFLGRDFISHAINDSSSTDENFADSSKEKDCCFQHFRVRSARTVKFSDESIWLSNTELPILSALWTRNCEMHSAVSFGTSLNQTRRNCREDKPSRKHRSRIPQIDSDSRDV
ncbi:hypothetical protein GQ55_9G452000 [Panicum hallii var. hallii]|uniref:Uncharacterized protein n=1 Tax=Panicum hallii var. hallii TaxID=1504633 RepID=A0A2T7CBU5_9POAL|nr:hypothetical protein GQ55_9G452000 [Panicum hallii var. hallii]